MGRVEVAETRGWLRFRFHGYEGRQKSNYNNNGRMAVEVEPPMEVNNNLKNIQFHKSTSDALHTEHATNDVVLTPYEKLIRELQHDEKVSKEISSGRRIGFYRIRGDLGSGNFSQVKLGYHCIAKGILEKLQCWPIYSIIC